MISKNTIDYNIEFTKGVLFVRLYGNIDRENEKYIQNDLYEIIKDGAIKYLVLNIENLEIKEDINLFTKCEEIINKNNGRMLICGNYNGNFINKLSCVDDELSALKEFSLC